LWKAGGGEDNGKTKAGNIITRCLRGYMGGIALKAMEYNSEVARCEKELAQERLNESTKEYTDALKKAMTVKNASGSSTTRTEMAYEDRKVFADDLDTFSGRVDCDLPISTVNPIPVDEDGYLLYGWTYQGIDVESVWNNSDLFGTEYADYFKSIENCVENISYTDNRKVLSEGLLNPSFVSIEKSGVSQISTSNHYEGLSQFAEDYWADRFENAALLYNDLSTRKDELESLLSDYERKIIDFVHYIEFDTGGTKNACALYRLYHETLKERRQLKEEYAIIDEILDRTGIKDMSGHIEQIKKKRDTKKKYSPRILGDLFKD
jgi:hypothetical protein